MGRAFRFFGSVNYGTKMPESATVGVGLGPDGELVAQLPHGEAGVLVVDIDPEKAHELYAARFAAEGY